MSLVWNPRSKSWEADIRSDGLGRLHVSLKTKRKSEGDDRHAAVKALFLEGNPQLIDLIRRRKLPVEAITRVYQSKLKFETLITNSGWPTLREAVDRYLEWMEQTDAAPSTKSNASYLLEEAILFFGDSRRLDQVTNEEVEEWKRSILARKVEGGTVKPWTAAVKLIRFGALYTFMRREEERRAMREKRSARLLHSPVEREIIPPKSAPRSRWLDRDEAKRLMAATPEALRFVVAAGLLAGLRIGEVISLRPPPQDLNFDVAGGVILVQEKEGWRPKSKRQREVPVAEELLPIAAFHAEKYASTSWMTPSLSDPAKPYNRDTLEAHFKIIVEDAGLVHGMRAPGGVTFHTLRHTFASWLVMAGVDLYTVSKLMGHSTIKQVEETYGHLSPNHKRLAMDRLGVAYNLQLDTLTEAEG